MYVFSKHVRLPEYMRMRPKDPSAVRAMKVGLRRSRLRTVCEEARCPNVTECFCSGTATFMILGRVCTRGCLFCAVEKGIPLPVDVHEPERVALAASELGLSYVVVTSVTRDDLEDGGAQSFADCVRAIRREIEGSRVEVLTPDFKGDADAVKVVVDSCPDVYNHNVETAPRLYPAVRPQAEYSRSLEVLRLVKSLDPGVATKSGMMAGLGESKEEILEVMSDLREAGCDIFTVGQYLRPSLSHHPVARYYTPEEFQDIERAGIDMGFSHVFSGPLVRSSFHAADVMRGIAAGAGESGVAV